MAQDVVFVGDPKVGAHLVTLEVLGVHRHHDLYLIFEALKHDDFVIRGKTRQYARGV